MTIHPVMFALYGFSVVLGVVHVLLRTDRSLLRRLLWVPVIMVPMLGILLYISCYEPPSVQPEHLRAEVSIS
ncbi:MAG: PLDc N-terminal domain-containing protein [Myxococcota bacterium]